MLLGYNTNGFASHRLLDAVEIIGELGYRSIGITLDHHALDPYGANLDAELSACLEVLGRYELAPVLETGARFLLDPRNKHQPTLLDDDPAARARRLDFTTRALHVANRLGAGVVSVWSGSAPEGTAATTDELDARLVEGLRALCARAAELGLRLGFEPEPGMHVETMAHFERIRTAVDHPALGLTLDVGHAHLLEAEGAEAVVARWSEAIVNVHLEGMRSGTHEHLPPWEGDLDVRGVVAALGRAGYVGPATLELSRSSHDAVRTARRALRYLRGD